MYSGKKLTTGQHIRKYAYSLPEEIYREFSTSSLGLTQDEAEQRYKKQENKAVSGGKEDTFLIRVRKAFVHPLTVVLFFLALLSLLMNRLQKQSLIGNSTSAIIIFIMIAIGGTIRLIQDLRSYQASRRLQRMVHTKIQVKRGGILLSIPAEKLVTGDYIYLSAGDRIPADLRITAARDLFVSQGALTGESAIVEKKAVTYSQEEECAYSQYENLAFMGTTVISGKGEGVVIAVGNQTLYGNFQYSPKEKYSSFEKGANSIVWVMLRFMLVLVPVVFLVSGITRGNWLEAFLFSLSVAVGLTPEMLPMIITACMAKGTIAMSKKKTVIKDINAMQGFGSMDVLCVDKTGTLTNEKILLEYYLDILGNESKEVLDLAYLNSLFHSGVKNPVDEAVIKAETMPGMEMHYEKLRSRYIKIDEIPFDYNRKCVSILMEDCRHNHQLVVKGEIEEVIARCSYVEYQGKVIPIEGNAEESVAEIADEMLEDGMKVIAVAKKILSPKNSITPEDEQELVFMGYLAFFDAPKKTACQAVLKLKELQVKTKILTGDRAEIARSICKRVEIDPGRILTGEEIHKMTDEQLSRAAERTDVFAQLTPSQKVRILQSLKRNGHTVGFLGDGMNDIPALCEADVGISVDNAVDAAKDAADVILLQKDLNVLEEGILEGRKTFVNMFKYIKITASSNFGNILSIVCASIFLPFLPMTAIQILLLNLLYDVLCIVLPWDLVDQEEYSHAREWSGRRLGSFMRFFGPISSLFDIVTFLFLYFILCPAFCGGLVYTQLTEETARVFYIALFQAGWFLESMWSQVLIIHMLRTEKIPFLQSRPSRTVLGITVAGIFLFTGFLYTPLGTFMGLTKVPFIYFGFLFLVVIGYMLVVTAMKQRYKKKYGELI